MKELLVKLILAYFRNTPPHPGRGILVKLAWRLQPQEFIAEIAPGVKMKVRLDRLEEILALTRTFNTDDEVGVFINHLTDGMVVMDVGANVGMITLLAAQKIGKTGRVYAFEPVPDIFARLKANIELNGFVNIVPVPIALFSARGVAKLSICHDGSSSIFRQVSTKYVEVLRETLDAFVEREGIKRVDAIKLDVEGAELHVIQGAHQTIQRFKPILMVEFSPANLQTAGTSPEELFETIVSYGYTASVIRKGKTISINRPVKPKWRGTGISYDDYLFLPIR